jgi:hypothetical protein
LYEDLALSWWVPEEKFTDFLKATGQKGFRGILRPEWMLAFAALTMLDNTGAYLEEIRFTAGGASPADLCSSIEATFRSGFNGSPLLLEPIEENEQVRTRVRVFG